MARKTFIVGIHLADYIQHNPQTAMPANKFYKAMKELTGKRKKTDADHEAIANIEYHAGLYMNGAGQVVLPSTQFEAAIAEGAKVSKEGKICLSSTFVEGDAVLSYDGGPLSLDELLASESHRLDALVRVGMAKTMRRRPYFTNACADFRVSLDTEQANAAQLRRWVFDALNIKGIGDWRPRHGRGEITKFEEMPVLVTATAAIAQAA